MLYTQSLFRALRKVHSARYVEPVDEDLRGWNWGRPPLRPRAYLELGISEIANGLCPTKRDLWLRRREGVRVEAGESMRIGIALHSIVHRVSTELSKLMARGLKAWDAFAYLYPRIDRIVNECSQNLKDVGWLKVFAKGIAFSLANIAGELGSIPLTEFVVDGSLLGLSRSLRVDALLHGAIVIEFKYGTPRESYPIALAGYALALESYLEIPVDIGILIGVSNGGGEPRVRVDHVYISNSLRQSFVEVRDEAIDILLSDTPPPKPSQCPAACPYRAVCGA